MAFARMLVAVAIIVAAVSSPVLGKEFMVGDDKGWTVGSDYQTWAAGKEFRVGDKLVFKYKEGFHNVVEVDETAFQQCIAPATSKPLTTGNDVITLESPGNKWYFCSVGKHCELGKQKVAITVLPQLESPAASPSQADASGLSPKSSTASAVTASKFYVGISVALGFLVMIMA